MLPGFELQVALPAWRIDEKGETRRGEEGEVGGGNTEKDAAVHNKLGRDADEMRAWKSASGAHKTKKRFFVEDSRGSGAGRRRDEKKRRGRPKIHAGTEPPLPGREQIQAGAE